MTRQLGVYLPFLNAYGENAICHNDERRYFGNLDALVSNFEFEVFFVLFIYPTFLAFKKLLSF